MLNDVRYAARALRRKPGFALTAILSVALGIGANASIFSFVDGILLRPLPVPGAVGVLSLRSVAPGGVVAGGRISWRDYLDFRTAARSFSGLAAYRSARFAFAPDAVAQPELKAGVLVSGNFFQVLGTEPRIGRGFRSGEDGAPGREPVVVLAHEFWKSQFAGDMTVVGRHIRMNGLEFTVVGVAPESFTGVEQFERPAFYVPASMGPPLTDANARILYDRADRGFLVKGRLKPGVSREMASAEVAAVARVIEQANPATNRAFGAVVRTEMQSRLDDSPGRAILPVILFGLVAVLLAISCANVANLMLSRGRSRAREMAIRIAIGAGRFRLLRQLMTESMAIALCGGAIGMLIAAIFVRAASSLQLPGDVPIDLSFQLDTRVLLFTVAVSFASAVLFGLAPALQSTRTDLVPALKTGEADNVRRRFVGRGALVTVQVAGSMVLLILAVQLYRGFSREMRQSPGFRRDHVLMMTFDPALIRYSPAQVKQFYRTLVERAGATPGVESVSLALNIPTGTSPRFEAVVPDGYRFATGVESASVWTDVVDENYFATLGVPLIAGRGFLTSDVAGRSLVAVVNQTFASHYLRDSAVGRRIRLGGSSGPWAQVVGVTAPGKILSTIEPPQDAVYLPFSQRPASKMTLLMRSAGDPAALAAPVREMARSIDPNMPVFGVRTMSDFFEQRSVRAGVFVTGLVGVIAMLGIMLALVGLYAVVAWQVAGRTREIGIRMAVGADSRRVTGMILRQAAGMGVTGVALGLALSVGASRALAGAGIPGGAVEVLPFTLLPAALLITTAVAAAIPARRAALVDPLKALRQD